MIIPGPLFGAIVAIILFFYLNHQLRVRREQRSERLRQRNEEYLESLLENLRKNKSDADANKTTDQQ